MLLACLGPSPPSAAALRPSVAFPPPAHKTPRAFHAPTPQGGGDPERDYQLVLQAAADEAAAALPGGSGSVAKRQKVLGGAGLAPAADDGGALEGAATPGRPGGDSAADVAGLLATHTLSGGGSLEEGMAAAEAEAPMTARSDVFDFLATPRTEAGAFAPPQVCLRLRN